MRLHQAPVQILPAISHIRDRTHNIHSGAPPPLSATAYARLAIGEVADVTRYHYDDAIPPPLPRRRAQGGGHAKYNGRGNSVEWMPSRHTWERPTEEGYLFAWCSVRMQLRQERRPCCL